MAIAIIAGIEIQSQKMIARTQFSYLIGPGEKCIGPKYQLRGADVNQKPRSVAMNCALSS